jgi:hypothetical protein
MIQPDARSRFTSDDLSLLIEWVTGGQATPEDVDIWLQDEDLDVVLDRPGLAERLLEVPVPGPSSSLLFYVLVRQTLLLRRLDDRRLADYCAALLREFGQKDRAFRIAPHDDHCHRYLVDILTDLSASTGERQFRVLVHLGNYALWFAGVFPDRIERVRSRRGGPDLSYYDALGGRGYAEASDHHLAERVGLADVFRITSDRFPAIRSALNEVSARLRRRAA